MLKIAICLVAMLLNTSAYAGIVCVPYGSSGGVYCYDNGGNP